MEHREAEECKQMTEETRKARITAIEEEKSEWSGNVERKGFERVKAEG